MEIIFLAAVVLALVYFIFLRKRPAKQPYTPIVVPPAPPTEPTPPGPYDPGTVYDPFKPIELPTDQQPTLELSAREKRIVELFAPYGQDFTAAKDVNRVSGDPAVASFDSAVERGVLETGTTADGKHGYRLTEAARTL